MNEFEPLKFSIKRCVLNGTIYDLVTYDEFTKMQNPYFGIAVYVDDEIALPYKGLYGGPTTIPGIYKGGALDFIVYPPESDRFLYTPRKVVQMDSSMSMGQLLQKKEEMSKLDEPWITSPDNITHFIVTEEDRPEMVCLKTALNKKSIDIDKYAGRFGDNFPNDKRQLKNTSATLNILKRFCKCMDMEALLTLRDKNPNVPNPIGEEITVSLTDGTDSE